MAATVLKSYEIRREREATWRALEDLVVKAEKRGLSALGPGELSQLPSLYRATLSSLSVARTVSLDKNVVAYLESLTARAYVIVYGTRARLAGSVLTFVTTTFPATVRRHIRLIAVALGFMVLGTVVAYALVRHDPTWFYTFVGDGYSGGRDPSTSTADLRAALYDTPADPGQTLTMFSSFLFSHNAQIGILAFALGFLFGVPVAYLMFQNGLVLGAFAGLYHNRGLGLELWAWLLPHGITELSAVLLCGGAGLLLARSLMFPGRRTRLASLAAAGKEAAVLVIGAVIMLFFAALIEGFFRQLVYSIPARFAMATATALFWGLYIGFCGRGAATGVDSA